MTLLSRLAGKSEAAVFLVYAERLAHGAGYHMHIQSTPAALNDRDIATSVAVLNQEVENCVRACPAQYQWSYQRFKTRPQEALPQ
jgi:KDO2-lipid IV(A) lauroyltransferase